MQVQQPSEQRTDEREELRNISGSKQTHMCTQLPHDNRTNKPTKQNKTHRTTTASTVDDIVVVVVVIVFDLEPSTAGFLSLCCRCCVRLLFQSVSLAHRQLRPSRTRPVQLVSVEPPGGVRPGIAHFLGLLGRPPRLLYRLGFRLALQLRQPVCSRCGCCFRVRRPSPLTSTTFAITVVACSSTSIAIFFCVTVTITVFIIVFLL